MLKLSYSLHTKANDGARSSAVTGITKERVAETTNAVGSLGPLMPQINNMDVEILVDAGIINFKAAKAGDAKRAQFSIQLDVPPSDDIADDSRFARINSTMRKLYPQLKDIPMVKATLKRDGNILYITFNMVVREDQ